MKILGVIDSLGSGGAQRQMVNLLIGLKEKGHDVAVFVYHPKYKFYFEVIKNAGIPIYHVHLNKGFSFKVIFKIVSLVRNFRFEVIISFLNVPNFYCEIASLFLSKKILLLVSERSSYLNNNYIKNLIFNYFHSLADAVIANSDTQCIWLKSHFWLKNKTHLIYNGYFVSNLENINLPKKISDSLQFLVIARIDEGKNGIRLAEAFVLFFKKYGFVPSLNWVGRQELDVKSLEVRTKIDEILNNNPEVLANWSWLGERNDVTPLLQNCDTLVHISLFEGLPNVVCEAFIAGRPAILSDVCDHYFLSGNGLRGILCNPFSVNSIFLALEKMYFSSQQDREKMGVNARIFALEYLTIKQMVSKYETLIKELSPKYSL